MNESSGDGTDSFEVQIRRKTANITNMVIARFRESRYLRIKVLIEHDVIVESNQTNFCTPY